MDNNFYIEFNINGVLRVLDEDKKEALEKLNSLISKIIEENPKLIRSEQTIDIVSEAEIVHAMSSYDPDHYD